MQKGNNRLMRGGGLEPDSAAFHMQLRLAAHFGVFFLSGLLFAAALAVSLPVGGRGHGRWFFLLAVLCSAGAVLAEVVKLQIPGRHLQWDETMLNVDGVLFGVLLVWLIDLLAGCRRARKYAAYERE